MGLGNVSMGSKRGVRSVEGLKSLNHFAFRDFLQISFVREKSELMELGLFGRK